MESSKKPGADPISSGLRPFTRWRMLKDRSANYVVGVGGVSVIVFIALIFFYLAYVVVPLFQPAGADQVSAFQFQTGDGGGTVHLAMEEQMEIGVRFTDAGQVTFFDVRSGKVLSSHDLAQGIRTTSFNHGDASREVFAFGLENGSAVVARHDYRTSFPDGKRVITPALEYPLEEATLQIDDQGQPLTAIAVQSNDDEATVVAYTADQRLIAANFAKEVSFLDDTVTLSRSTTQLPPVGHDVDFMALDKRQRNLYLLSRDGQLTRYDLRNKDEPALAETLRLVPDGQEITAVRLLTGHISLLVGDSTGAIRQWTTVDNANNEERLVELRSFHEIDSPVTALSPEYGRKGFLSAHANGTVGVYHTTAHRTLLVEDASPAALVGLAVSPRANGALIQDATGRVMLWRIHNEHPEVSWSSLWGKVWYENYDEPRYIWQSSSASDDFEPKFSLVPITFGTLKAAFYAMLLAIPLSLMGALYTAQFMAPRMRGVVKPSIEIMEALPTVILGFLAGLWLAPFVESYLPGVFSLLLLMPFGLLLSAYLWNLVPDRIRLAIPAGWEAALLLPAVALIAWASVALSPLLENAFFGGDMRLWLTNEMGVGFDQRNAIVVGLAMGFAVIPTIFSIAEDAVFGVPKHLVQGSLALGATPWQTMVRVVLLTASPGIFSAIMIGLGRAVGETMIVLMATGNTPVMEFSPFEGLRTLSANIAVELPESEVNSTHFRILFLAGLVLFMFTFAVNTVAEIVRQRLRRKYSTL